jgi:hypothetical protein
MLQGRKLSLTFMDNLQKGFLKDILGKVQKDPDLDLQIRHNYFNIYFKGNSLLKFSEINASLYQVEIHPKFIAGMSIPNLVDEPSTWWASSGSSRGARRGTWFHCA